MRSREFNMKSRLLCVLVLLVFAMGCKDEKKKKDDDEKESSQQSTEGAGGGQEGGEEEGPETTSVEHTQRLSVQRARSMVYLGPVPCNL